MKKSSVLLLLIMFIITSAACSINNKAAGRESGQETTGSITLQTSKSQITNNTVTEAADIPSDSKTETKSSPKTVSTAYEITGESHTEKNVKINYPQIKNFHDSQLQKDINEAIKSEALKVLNYFDSNLNGLTLEIDYDITWKGTNLLSIQFSGFANVEGAAHPSNYFYTANINLINCKKIRLDDYLVIDKNFLDKISNGEFILPEASIINKDIIIDQMNIFNDEEKILSFKNADSIENVGTKSQSDIFSFFTEGYLGISIVVGHAAGDHAEFLVKLKDMESNFKTQAEVWEVITEIPREQGAGANANSKPVNDEPKMPEFVKDGLKVLKDQSFYVEFESFGKVWFITSELSDGALYKLCFYLLDEKGNILYTLPEFYGNQWSTVEEFKAVAFKDADNDGLKDVIIIADYITGIGPTGAEPFSVAGVYLQKDKEFISNPDLDEQINKKGQNETIDMVMKFLKSLEIQ